MVSYSNILKFLSKPVYRCSLSQRVYYSARAAPARSTDGPTPRRQKRVSKKAFDELPTALTDPFGRAVAPLGEYEDSYNPIPRAKRSKRKNLEASSKGLKLPRRKREPPTGISTGLSAEVPVQTYARPQTQLALSIFENLAKFPHCILLTRVGQFYESYFDQASEVAHLLSIKLTTKSWGGQRVPMCGFPLMHLDRHSKTLVQQHKRFVAMCEEFKRSDGTFDRRVVRVVTPGTLIDESFLNHYENNYLAAVSSASDTILSPGSPVGLAWIDVSTGDFFSQDSTIDSLRDDLARIGPREVVLDTSVKLLKDHPFRTALGEEVTSISYTSPDSEDAVSPPPAAVSDDIRLSSRPVFSSNETAAIRLLTSFLHAHLLESMPQLTAPSPEIRDARMHIDSHTIKALEIKEGMREGGVTGSLLSVIKRTVTSSGTRLLARRLCSPSTSLSEINARQSLVALFVSSPHLRADLTELLKEIQDASRIVQKFLLGRGETDDLANIKDTIKIWNQIKARILQEEKIRLRETGPTDVGTESWRNCSTLIGKMADLQELADRISMAVDESALRKPQKSNAGVDGADEEEEADEEADLPGPTSFRAWTIKPGFSLELTSLHNRLANLMRHKDKLQLKLRDEFNSPTLNLRSSNPHGLHVHVGKVKHSAAIEKSSKAVPVGRSASTRSYFYQEWSILGSEIMETESAIYAAERRAFDTLRSEVIAQASSLRRNARIVDELDVTLGFADLAHEMNFVRPVLDNSTSYHVVNGRHPTVELGLLTSGRVFTPNTISLNPASQLHIITGPNMSGKSSVLRQTALIAILAQAGSFVPADRAQMGIIDKVFSRVGAKDDLFRDRSTFMVEMLETCEILRRATDRSLVIMDEVGRGTTVKDGVAIAFATVNHLYSVNKCRALFATHFHEVADMLGYNDDAAPATAFENIGFFCTDVDETDDGHFAYSHRLRPGVNRNSHGLKVARMAGMPPAAVEIASRALEWIDGRGGNWVSDRRELRILGERLSAEKN